MWQLDRAATKASSGSTASSRDIGNGTTDGDEDAWNLDAAIEAPDMAAAVAAVGEQLSVSRPAHRGGVFVRHRPVAHSLGNRLHEFMVLLSFIRCVEFDRILEVGS